MKRVPPPAPTSWPSPGTHERFIQITLCALTPIYKGGSRKDQLDEGRPFRAPSIRGALRYWWRATSEVEDEPTLRAREKALFGGVHGDGPVASGVSVAILDQKSTPGPRPSNKSYAFGVTGKEPDGDARKKQVHHEASGELRVGWREDALGENVERALRAWLLFGGIGGRSRRGAGSVWWSGGFELPDSIEAYVRLWRALVPQRETAPWPTLANGALIVGPGRGAAERAWAEGLDGMRDVRASQDVRAPFVSMRGEDLFWWKRRDYIPICNGRTFRSARAALGLPIRFNSKGAGFRGVLNADAHNRYPSPIHLKVVQLDGLYHPVFIVLRGPAPNVLKAGSSTGELDRNGLDEFIKLAARLPDWKLHDLGGPL